MGNDTSLLPSAEALPSPIILAMAVIAVTLYFWPIWKMSQYPPGPIPLPFFGQYHRLLLSQNAIKTLAEEYGKKYGEIFTVWFASKPVVMLNSYEAIQEGFVKNAEALSSRPQSSIVAVGKEDALGIIGGKDGDWQPLRRHALTVLRDHGVGKDAMEEQISDELQYYLQALDQMVGQPYNPSQLVIAATSGVITRIIFGSRFDYDSEQIKNVHFSDYLSANNKIKTIPLLKYLPGDPLNIEYEAKKKRFNAGVEFAKQQISLHKKDLDVNNPRDFIDSFLLKLKNDEADIHSPFNEDNLVVTAIQLYIAGADTTSTALNWGFLQMMLNADIQEKVHREIDEVIGSRLPQYTDRTSMPYTQAVLSEILRLSIAPCTLQHIANETITVRGQIIPKGTNVTGLLWTFHYDEKLYPKPYKFNPSHFLDADGSYVTPNKSFLPFGLGRRVCLGMALARTELFLFFVVALQRFKVTKVPGEIYESIGKLSFTYSPLPYKMLLVRRMQKM